MKSIWISLPYATFGIVVSEGAVISAAPIAQWMVGKDTKAIRAWIAKKGGLYEVISKEG